MSEAPPSHRAHRFSMREGYALAPRPKWLAALNRQGSPDWVPIEERALLDEAMANTGLSDFGADDFREPFGIVVRSIDEEARLNLVGRILARADLVNLLENRLRIADWRRRHPEIGDVDVGRPIFITGLPRTGTSILHELLGQDPAHRVPRTWEVRYPCPPPETATYATDPRIERADLDVKLWNWMVPEYETMHELGGTIPVECIVLTAHSFRSDQLSGTHQLPSYDAWLARADMRPAYVFHREMLQLLHWRAPGERWVLKAPSHLAALEALLDVYPDARIVQTHRDPLRVMSSVASILCATAWVRSDEVDARAIRDAFGGQTCDLLLGNSSRLRDEGRIRGEQICDVLYSDLVRDPLATVQSIYDHFGIGFSEEARAQVRAYVDAKPKDRQGVHAYAFADTGFDLETERVRFAPYMERYGVPEEVSE